MKPESISKILLRPPAIWVFFLFGVWWVFVGLSGSSVDWPGGWDFTTTGQLGDSFGIVSALMTSMAAIFTYQALRETRGQAEKMATIEANRDAVSSKRDAEQTYFRLLELRLTVLKDLVFGSGDNKRFGVEAAQKFIERMRMGQLIEQTLEERYNALFEDKTNSLGHYFRLTYHAVLYADERFNKAEAYKLIRLLRAQLSDAEITLIALNCAFGEGRGEFKKLVEKYCLLHNISQLSRDRFELDSYFKPTAFERKKRRSN